MLDKLYIGKMCVCMYVCELGGIWMGFMNKLYEATL